MSGRPLVVVNVRCSRLCSMNWPQTAAKVGTDVFQRATEMFTNEYLFLLYLKLGSSAL